MQEYIPLTPKTVELGQTFGPVSFAITQQTRNKTVRLIEEADLDKFFSLNFK